MSMLATAHEILYWLAAAVILAGCGSAWLSLARRWTGAVLAVGLLTLTLAIVPRWILTGHPPIFGTYENSIAAAWSLMVGVLILRARHGVGDVLSKSLTLWLPPLLAVGWFFDRTPYPLTISERNLLVDVHVLFAWTAHTALLIASTAAIIVVLGKNADGDRDWDTLLFRNIGYGYVALTIMLVVGSAYSYLLFGDWYKWEITEAFAAAAWLGYASVLHAAMMFNWSGKKLAWAMLAVLPLMLATFWVWSFYSGTYHHFEIPAIRAK